MVNKLWVALKWAYSDSLRHIAFMLSVAVFVGFLMTFIAYPIQTIATLLIGFGSVVLFLFFTEYR